MRREIRGRSRKWLGEGARLAVLAATAAWLLHPFATSRRIGAGDALWYANMLADYVTQLRAGNFPILAGQTAFAFNGAVYPLRVAPLYQHLAGALDLLTGRSLGFFSLQHLTVIVAGVAAIYACYGVLCAVEPSRRWTAAALSILYLSCPGILGTIYTQDLYMTWMTVPFAPLAAYGMVRTFRSDNAASQIWLAAPLAALWWAHSPIALWITGVGALSQLVRLAAVHRTAGAWKRAVLGGLLFLVLAQYPFVSVAELHVPGQDSTVIGGLPHPEWIWQGIRDNFPADVRPVSAHAHALSDLQLGYGLWLILALALAGAAVARRWDYAVLLGSSVLLLVLILPVPGVTASLWLHLPEELKRITYYWPMQRFYLILAALLAVAGQGTLTALLGRIPTANRLAAVAVALAVAWSLEESRQFVAAGKERTASAAESSRSERPENLLLMNHAYGLFSALPPYFSNGTMEPGEETRLLATDSLLPLPSPLAPLIEEGKWTGRIDANPGILDLSPEFQLEPGKRYELEFDFAQRDLHGVLQLAGTTLFREYVLPSSGEAWAFGSAKGNDPRLILWSTEPHGDTAVLRFIPTAPGETPADFIPFGGYRLRMLDEAKVPVQVLSLMPFRATIRTPQAAWLETPRMFMPGYRATLDGRPAEVRPSPRGLAMSPVTPANRAYELRFVGPFALRISYALAGMAWTIVAGVALVGGARTIAAARTQRPEAVETPA